MKNFIFFLVLFLFSLSCTKRENCPHYFNLQASYNPLDSVYQVGDTITLLSKFQKDVTGFSFGNKDGDKDVGKFDLSGVEDWELDFSIAKIDSDSAIWDVKSNLHFIRDSVFDFDLFTYNDGSTSVIGNYNFENDSLILKSKFVLKRTGIFILTFGSGLGINPFAPLDFPGKCRRIAPDAWMYINNRDDLNIDLLSESPDPHFNTWILEKPEDRFYKKGSFCFRVE